MILFWREIQTLIFLFGIILALGITNGYTIIVIQ